MKKDVRTTIVPYNDFVELGFKHPSKYFVRIATGDYLFIHTQLRQNAQKYSDGEFGKGKYIVRCSE